MWCVPSALLHLQVEFASGRSPDRRPAPAPLLIRELSSNSSVITNSISLSRPHPLQPQHVGLLTDNSLGLDKQILFVHHITGEFGTHSR